MQGFGIRQEFRLQGYLFFVHLLVGIAWIGITDQQQVFSSFHSCFTIATFICCVFMVFAIRQWVDGILVVLCSFTTLLTAISTGFPLYMSIKQERLEQQAQVCFSV